MSEIPPPTVPPATPPPPGGGSYTPPPPPPPGGGYGAGPASSDRTLMIALSYLWILVLVPLLTKKDDPEVQWHAKNGLGITIGEILAWVVYMVITMFAPSMISCLASVLSCAIGLGFFVIRIMAIIKGINGQRFTVPVLSDLGTKINI
ncbi:MAG: DUF4870 domain-containing protein [Acidobacteriota bacterium]|nr:DUF4870 domain-containing protein [Acidobacteriota bacterium]